MEGKYGRDFSFGLKKELLRSQSESEIMEMHLKFKPKEIGEYIVELKEYNNITYLRAYALLHLMKLVCKRSDYIVKISASE